MRVSQTSPLLFTCIFNYLSYYFGYLLCCYGLFCLFYGEAERCQVPSAMSVAIPFYRYDHQHFDACRMLLQNNTTRSKHDLHYTFFICFGMPFFCHSTGQVFTSYIDLLNVKHLRRPIKKLIKMEFY